MRRPVRISAMDLLLTALAFVLSAAVEVGLRTMRLPRLARSLGVPLAVGPAATRSGGPHPSALPRSARRRLAASRRALRRWPFDDTCLRQALVGGAMIRKLHPELRIGVAKQDGKVKAHAWIELDGFSLDPGSRNFASVERVVQA